MSRSEAILKELTEMEVKRRELVNEYVSETCPHKIGDRTKARGYTYEGKECEIVSISNRVWVQAAGTEDMKVEVEWKVFAKRVLASGKLSQNIFNWTQSEEDLRSRW